MGGDRAAHVGAGANVGGSNGINGSAPRSKEEVGSMPQRVRISVSLMA